ncbi:MAG: glycerol kinase GlpK [Clostridiales bacterium]|nr:glycerol kinase GlpK [Clostridiales bacterium]
MSGKYILALDEGTTSARAVLFDKNLNICGVAQKEFTQIYPKPSWVEHDPMEIYACQYGVMSEVIAKCGVEGREIDSIGITNQRETTIVWNKLTGKPVYNAIVWQCRRTSDYCTSIKGTELAEYIRENTGLVPDAYFSATKIKWILDNVEGARDAAERGELLFGTVDTWLLWKLTDGRSHKTDETNAARTMIYNIKNHCWDKHLLDVFGIPESMLPEVLSSGDDFGYTEYDGEKISICGMAGDQQSSLFGHCCFERGSMKNTYGTGCFVLANTGSELIRSKNGLVTTIAATLHGEHAYALEGSVFTGGAVIQWLRDEMKLIDTAAESERLALSVEDSNGVYVVPAFTGMGAPYWNMYARGTIIGLTRGANRCHIVRAALEAIAYQSKDVLDTMAADIGTVPEELHVDGGACANNFLMQFQADITKMTVARPKVLEATAMGAAMLAGLYTGFFPSYASCRAGTVIDRKFFPKMSDDIVKKNLAGWNRAVWRALDWEEQGDD